MGKPAGGGEREHLLGGARKVWVLVFPAPRPHASLSLSQPQFQGSGRSGAEAPWWSERIGAGEGLTDLLRLLFSVLAVLRVS